MKVFAVFLTEYSDYGTKMYIKGVFSTMEKTIDLVNELDLNGEIEDRFSDDEKKHLVIDNHNNGFIQAYLNDGYHEIIINFNEIDMDSPTEIKIY